MLFPASLRPHFAPLLCGLALLVVAAGLARGAESPVPLPEREIGLPFFEVFEPRVYGGHTQVWSVVEDAAGVLYFGNFGRVLTFDGTRWSHFLVPETTFVRALAFDAQDTLWIGAVDELGYAMTDATGARKFVSLKDKVPAAARGFGEVWRVLITPRGPIFQSNTALLRWNGKAFAMLALPAPGGWQEVLAGDTVWVSHTKHGWNRLTDDGTTLSLNPVERPAVFATAVQLFAVPGAAPGEFIFGTGRAGLARWDGKQITPFPTGADELLKQKRPYRACRLADGRFAVSSLQGGLFLFDAKGRLIANLDQRGGLPDNTVLNVGTDRHGGLWLCLERGVVRVDARPWLTWFGPASGVPRSQLATLRHKGALLAASNVGLLRLEPATSESPARFAPVPGFPEFLSTLVEAGDAVIGLGEQGLFEWRGEKSRMLEKELNDGQSFVAAVHQPGRWFLLAADQMYTFRNEGGNWHAEGKIEGCDNVRSIVEDSDGSWWFGQSTGGVLRASFPAASEAGPGKPVLKKFGVAEGLPEGHGWARVMMVGGHIMLRCEKGFLRFSPAQEKFFPTEEFGSRFANGTFTGRTLVEDPHGGLWIAARAAGQAELITPLDLGLANASGWHALRIPELARLDDVGDLNLENDVLWISGHSGIVRADLAQWRTSTEPHPALVLRGVTGGSGERLPLAGGWELPYAQRSLRLSFASPDLQGDTNASYESTLVSDAEPITLIDATPERSFAALAPGAYRLRLRARGGAGSWSAPIELAFTVRPPWWSSGWAWAGYVGLLGVVLASGVRQRTHALQRRAERLEIVVAERTEELQRSNTELARLHRLELDEKIAARLAEEKARLEVLRYQLNPHFLFNALTSVRAQLPAAMKAARETIGQLTEFCRSTLLRPSGDNHPTLAEEMEMVSSYLAIEQTRWGDWLNVTMAIEPAAAEQRVPPLLLLPLVENALKYGRATSPDRLGIRIGAHVSGDALVIEIANTGEWVEPEAGSIPSLGIGAENLRQRLRRFYPNAHDFTTTTADGWVRARLRLVGPPVT